MFTITNCAELHAALTSDEPFRRLAALDAIQKQPRDALAFGLFNSSDVIDMLLAEVAGFEGGFEWISWIGSLSVFEDPRVTRFFAELLCSAPDPEVIFFAAHYLKVRGGEIAPQIPELLVSDDAARIRAAASLLSFDSCRTIAHRIRFVLATDAEMALLPTFREEPEPWLAELHGPLSQDAQMRLETAGPEIFRELALRFDELSLLSREWLIEWGVEAYPEMAVEFLTPELEAASTE